MARSLLYEVGWRLLAPEAVREHLRVNFQELAVLLVLLKKRLDLLGVFGEAVLHILLVLGEKLLNLALPLVLNSQLGGHQIFNHEQR